MNVDLKIITRVLAKRLSTVISNIIKSNQTCVPGRHIFVNLPILQVIIDYINGSNTNAAIIFIDSEKACDCMSHSFLLKTLRHFGCGDNFIKWIKIIYDHCTARVKVNGFNSAPILVKRGIRQGCPLSSLLYVLCVEVLSLEISKNERIIGFKHGNDEYKNSDYADDLSCLVTDQNSIEEPFETLNKFGKATNSKVNVDKTKAIWVGNWKQNEDIPNNLKWTNVMVKNLGIYIGNNRKEIDKSSFLEAKDKIKDKLTFWTGKGISLKGKVRVINTFILPKLWYICEIHNIPEQIKNEIKQMITHFIWEGYTNSLLNLFNNRISKK